jgi:membrane protein
MLLGFGFLLLVSLAVSAAMAALIAEKTWLWQSVNIVASLFVYFLLFGFLLVFLPDVKIRWRDALIGSIITAILFSLGKFLIGQYLGRSTVGSAYGAAGSFFLMLLWVYYSALIVFYGTELAVVFTQRYGGKISPLKLARWRDPLKRQRLEQSKS